MNHNIYKRPTGLVPVDKGAVSPLLYRLLSLCTPKGTEGWIIDVILRQKYVKDLKFKIIDGNLLIWLGEKQETMFSAHMDIVGEVSKENKARNCIDIIDLMEDPEDPEYFYGAKRYISADGKSIEHRPSTLGADDKVGVYILCELMRKGVNGLYVFHQGEESGGIGSKILSTNHKDLFKNYKRCIAFDRAGYEDVIAHQRGTRCASKKFTNALAKELNKYMPPFVKYKGDVRGVFTDTANYTDIIPECTNISCGYFQQHGYTEHLDYAFLRDSLLPAALKIDYDSLPTERDPSKKEYEYSHNYYAPSYYNRGSNHYPSSGSSIQTTWKTVTKDTKEFNMPKWVIRDGWIDECDPEIFAHVVVQKLVKKMYLGNADKEEIAEEYFAMMQLNQLLLEEVEALKVQIEMMSQPEEDAKFAELAERVKKEKKEKKIVDVPFDDPVIIGPCCSLKNNIIQLPLLPKPEPDTYIFDKKALLENLSEVCRRVRFRGETIKDGFPAKFAKQQVESFLNEHKNFNSRSSFSKNKIKKMNRMIFHMAYWLNTEGIDLSNQDKELLNIAAEYMIEHQEERGWLGNNYRNTPTY